MRSEGEALFLFHCKGLGLPMPEEEYKFAPKRRFRFDFAWKRHMLAVEVEGGIYSFGRHTRGKGYESDLAKYNLATMLGWRVLRYSTQMVKSGEAVKQVAQALLRRAG